MATRVHFRTLSAESLVITEDMRITSFSVSCVSGTVTVNGDLSLEGVASEAVNLAVGGVFTMLADNANEKFTGITIDASSGVASFAASNS